MRILAVLSFSLLCTVLSSQSLVLTSGSRQKSIHPGHWIEVAQGEELAGDCYCPKWQGQFVRIEDGKLFMRVSTKLEIETTQTGQKTAKYSTYYSDPTSYPETPINIDQISSITLHGRGKKFRATTFVQATGFVMLMAGFGTLTTAAYIDQQGEVLLAGLGEMILGAGLASASPRRFILSEELAIRQDKRRWQTQ